MRNLVLLSTLLLTACATAGAEPERYAGLSCQQLSDLKRVYGNSLAQFDLFNDRDINELGRTNAAYSDDLSNRGSSRIGLTNDEKRRAKDINSIRAASRLQGC